MKEKLQIIIINGDLVLCDEKSEYVSPDHACFKEIMKPDGGMLFVVKDCILISVLVYMCETPPFRCIKTLTV